MRRWPSIARIFLGLFFAVSGFLKLLEPYQNFLAVIHSYDILHGAPAKLLAMGLPWLEFLGGIFLALGLWGRFSLCGLWALNTSFIFALASAIQRKLSLQECGCFGDWVKLSPKQTLAMDSALWFLFAALVVLYPKTAAFSLDRLFSNSKTADKTTNASAPAGSRARSSMFVWMVAAFALVGIFVWFKAHRHSDPAEKVLVAVGDEKFRRKDLDPSAQKQLEGFDQIRRRFLSEKAREWATEKVLKKEASARSKSVEALLKEEVENMTSVSDQEAERRYALSPSADSVPYAQAIEIIRNEMKAGAAVAKKRQLAESLYQKYGVRFFVKPPATAETRGLSISRFPLYRLEPAGADVVNGQVVRAPFLGPASAPVVLEVFSDFMCPFSARFSETTKKIHEAYPDKVRIEYRHFPLPFHPGADSIAEAAVCAEEQGKFWEFHDAFFASAGSKDRAALLKTAESAGLDAARLDVCLSSGKYKEFVQKDAAEGRQRGVQGTPSFFINGRFSVGALPFEALKPRLDWMLDPKGPVPPVSAPSQAPAIVRPTAGQASDPVFYEFKDSDLAGSPSKGPSNAPVTLVEFVDFNCPFCRKGFEVLKEVEKNFGAQIRFVSKQYPLPMHPNAQNAALAALCANDQGRYWQYHDLIFGEGWGKQSKEDLKTLAKQAGLDTGKFGRCLDEKRFEKPLEADIALANSKGVSATPSYFVNGQPLIGAQPYPEFEKLIKEKLKK